MSMTMNEISNHEGLVDVDLSETKQKGSHTEAHASATLENERLLFDKAKDHLNLGGLFRLMAGFISERKLIIFMTLYFTAVVVVFTHFALLFGNHLLVATGGSGLLKLAGSPFNQWMITRFPIIEAGGVNSALMLIALLPLTMSRYSLSRLSDTIVDTFIPVKRAVRIHIVSAWTMFIAFTILLITFIYFILIVNNVLGVYPGRLLFTNQMFITGYMIYSILLTLAISSYLRFKIKYEIFYYLHQLVLVFFVVLIFHTLGKFRSQLQQAYPWIVPSFLFYICDRLAMKLFHTYKSKLISVTTASATDGASKAMIIRLERPTLFAFKPGQYAYIRLCDIDSHWHPFSIASDPDSDHLEFFIGVEGKETSWSSKLSSFVGDGRVKDTQFEIMGPYGSPLGKAENYSHVLAIGSGTGIVPVLSLLRSHVNRLLKLDPEAHCHRLDENYTRVVNNEIAKEAYKGSLGAKVLTGLRLRKMPLEPRRDIQKAKVKAAFGVTGVADDTTAEMTRERLMKMKSAAFEASRSLYGIIILSLLTVYGVALIGFTISWNTLTVTPAEARSTPWDLISFRYNLMIATAVFHGIFAVPATCYFNCNSLVSFVDLVLIVIMPFVDWLWFLRIDRQGIMTGGDIACYVLTMAYFVGRLWYTAVKPQGSNAWRQATQVSGISALQRLDAVWIIRSATMASQLLPEISECYETLVKAWGHEHAKRVCRIQIHITENEGPTVELLRQEILRSSQYRALYDAGCFHFGRPDLEAIVESHSLELISSHRNTYTLLSFCGSVGLSSELQRVKVQTDMLKAVTGNKKHVMDYESECHGGFSKQKRKDSNGPAATESSNEKAVGVDNSVLGKKASSLTMRTVTQFADAASNGSSAEVESDNDKVV